jgi:hypothetical protein
MHRWLVAHVYRHGRKFEPNELIARATGAPMTIGPYLEYLRGKYRELYRLPAETASVSPAPRNRRSRSPD